MVSIESDKTEMQINSEILDLFNEGRDIKTVLDRTVGKLAGYLRCEALGIRVMDRQGNIPYSTYVGFSDGFIKKESPLCIRHDRCACIEITRGEYDPSAPVYTPYGSFHTDELQSLQPVREGMKAGRFRGECVRSGWESLALVPIRYAHKYMGLIHAVDGKKAAFPLDKVRFVENVAALLGLYMHSLDARAERESEFSALVLRIMHDLRSPLASTKMFAELIASELPGNRDPELKDLVEPISRNADYMEQLILALSNFAQACEPSPDEKKVIDLNEFIRGIVSDLSAKDMQAARITVSDNLPRVTYSPLGLRRVLTNLITNAVKYSSGGGRPVVEIACLEKDMFYQLSVTDNGMGMDSSDLGRVFNPFYRTEGVKNIPGTGLGLSICRKIVENCGGEIWVYSDKGKGSTFYFTVPK